MKYLFRLTLLSLIIFLISGCTKVEEPQIQWEKQYSTIDEFIAALDSIKSISELFDIPAYKDTLDNGYPDVEGESFPLSDFVDSIQMKIEKDSIESAVYDVFHFDGTPFSLISYLMKARLAEKITPQQMVETIGFLPLPPVEVVDFAPPRVCVVVDTLRVHKCFAKMQIRIVWVYYSECGNRKHVMDVYAANNTLTDRPTNTVYNLFSEIEHCGCGGTTTCTLDAPPGAVYGFSGRGDRAMIFSETASTYKITFTYTCSNGCGLVVSETFTISFR